jgi:predicted transcriptional regulator
MKHFTKIRDALPVLSALDSSVRIRMIELLLEKGPLYLDYFAKDLNISNAAVTKHIRILLDADIIQISTASGIRGSKKMCSLNMNKLIVDFEDVKLPKNIYAFDIPIGDYIKYDIAPTCGMATIEHCLGEFDNPKYFSFPEHHKASVLWFKRGFLEYMIPNPTKIDEDIQELQISMEIASEAPGFSSNYPSDINFFINGVALGFWTTPGEFNDRKGNLTPNWWFPNLGQYGQLKMLSINHKGTFMDGLLISTIKLNDLNIRLNNQITFRIEVSEESKNVGGLTLFGKGFGDYNSGIEVQIVMNS